MELWQDEVRKAVQATQTGPEGSVKRKRRGTERLFFPRTTASPPSPPTRSILGLDPDSPGAIITITGPWGCTGRKMASGGVGAAREDLSHSLRTEPLRRVTSLGTIEGSPGSRKWTKWIVPGPKKKRPVIKGKKKKQKEGERKRQRSPCPGNSPGGPNGGIWRAPGHGTPPLMPPQAAAAAASALNGVGRIGTWPAAAARAAPGGEPCPIPIADGDPGEPLPFRPPGCEPLSLSSWSISSMSTIESSSSSWFESLCGVSVCRSGSRFRSELPSCWDRGEEELVVWEDRLAGSMSLDGEVPGRVVVVTVVSAVVIAWCSSAAPCGGPCTISGLSGVSEGGVGVVVVGVPEVMMAWCALGVLGRVSASRDATLKLLIRELLFCCMGTVGLVIAIRTGVTTIVCRY
uniref:Uncharacterized protein n=1 Tax=Anopheles merus TaxID=30066 RepID=A0A182V1C4_ANOME